MNFAEITRTRQSCRKYDPSRAVEEDKLLAILEAARKNNVIVAIEPHGTFSLTLAGLQRMMKLAPADVLGINFDACNVFRASYVESGNNQSGWVCAEGKEDELTVLKGIADRVVHCHAKDINNARQCVAVGTGSVNVKGCVEYLKSIDYKGVVSVETEGVVAQLPNGELDFDSVVELAAKSYDYLNSIIKA